MKIADDNINFDDADLEGLSASALAGLQIVAKRTNITPANYLSGVATDAITAAKALATEIEAKELASVIVALPDESKQIIRDVVAAEIAKTKSETPIANPV